MNVFRFVEQNATSNKKGVDIVVEMAAQKMLDDDLKVLKKNGRVVVSSLSLFFQKRQEK